MAWRVLHRRDREAEIRAEIDMHLRMAIQDRIDRGESPEQARRHAHLEFGSVRLAREDARAVWTWTTAEQVWMDVRGAARILTRSPGLSATAVLLIALVIGGNKRTMEKDLEGLSWTVRTLTALLMAFALGSLVIAALGQYAAMSFATRRRVRDFGIRIAVGAAPRQILASAMREGFRLTAAGLAIGAALGFATGRAGRGLLYGVTPTDFPTYAGVMAILGLASLAACYLPARRAARIDPLQALRHE